jgi:hypothetical protein
MLFVSILEAAHALNETLFIPCQMRTRVAKLLVSVIALVWFPEDYPLWIQTCKNIRCNIIIQISKQQHCKFYWLRRANC